MEKTKEFLGERLRLMRTKRGWTREKLSELSGVPYRTIQDIETGKTQDPRNNTVQDLAKALGVTVGYLNKNQLEIKEQLTDQGFEYMKEVFVKTLIDDAGRKHDRTVNPEKYELFDLIDKLPKEAIESMLSIAGMISKGKASANAIPTTPDEALCMERLKGLNDPKVIDTMAYILGDNPDIILLSLGLPETNSGTENEVPRASSNPPKKAADSASQKRRKSGS